MPPRHGKSEIASRRFPAWYLGRNPTHQIITASYNAELASDFGRAVRNIFSEQEYKNLFDVRLAQDSQAANRWHTDRGGVYVAVGIGGTATGRGADVALIDDPVKDAQDAASETIRDSTWDWYVSVLRTRLQPRAAQCLIQTRWHDDDLAGRILNGPEGKRWHVIEMPALNEDGEALWPEAYPAEDLEAIKLLDPRRFSALYQQRPQPEEGTFFQRDWFRWYKPDGLPSLNCYTTADFAVTEGGGDYTEIGTHGVSPNGDIYLGLSWYAGQVSADVWIDQLLAQVRRHKPMAFFGESGPIRRAIEPLLIRRMRETDTFCRMEWITRTRDKATMARPLQARAAMGKVYLPDNEVGHRLLGQLLAFPAGLHDDAVDCAGLIALALDQAHPATTATVEPIRKKRDRWDIVFGEEDESGNWKTA